MTYKHLSLDLSAVETPMQFHKALKDAFGFPETYERTTRGLIDCLSSLRRPEEGMSTFVLDGKDDVLVLQVKQLSEKNKYIIGDFIIAVEQVNYRALAKNTSPSILLVLTK